jgi:hypothetical protein
MRTKKLVSILVVLTILSTSLLTNAQTPLWQGKGRIAISSDGNEHDHDDWAATPLSLALLAAAGLQDNLVIYTYSDHIWGSNQSHPTSASGLNSYLHMRESALGGQKWFGFDKTKFVCAVDNAEVAYTALRDVINESTADNPLIIIAAGPMQVVGEAINRADQNKRQFASLVSHSNWNNMHSDKHGKEYWDIHTGWTFQKIKDSFSGDAGGNLKCIQITDQNGGSDYDGFNAPIEKFDWIKNSEARNNPVYKPGAWDWLYTRMETCTKENGKNFDPSDAGMIVYLLTGIEKTEPEMGKKIMENPVKK